MKRRGFKHMLTGFLFILLDIHLFVDILPDPLGYGLIAAGIHKLSAEGKHAKNAVTTAYILLILSIPTFIFSGPAMETMQNDSMGWLIYGVAVSIGHLILMYFTFQMLMNEVDYPVNAVEIRVRVRKMMVFYMSMMLSAQLLHPFLFNMNQDSALILGILIIGLTLIATIAFLVHLRGLQKMFPPAPDLPVYPPTV